MKRILVSVTLAVLVLPALADKYVNGYVRKDGTYVAPHMRSDANSTRTDNWSAQGNYNPYTGEKGHTDPYRTSPNNAPRGNEYPGYSVPDPYGTHRSRGNGSLIGND